MKLIDARSGVIHNIPPLGHVLFSFDQAPRFDYGDGETTTIHAIKMGLLSGHALATTSTKMPDGRLSTWHGWAPLTVRLLHPGFWGQRVAFIPS